MPGARPWSSATRLATMVRLDSAGFVPREVGDRASAEPVESGGASPGRASLAPPSPRTAWLGESSTDARGGGLPARRPDAEPAKSPRRLSEFKKGNAEIAELAVRVHGRGGRGGPAAWFVEQRAEVATNPREPVSKPGPSEGAGQSRSQTLHESEDTTLGNRVRSIPPGASPSASPAAHDCRVVAEPKMGGLGGAQPPPENQPRSTRLPSRSRAQDGGLGGAQQPPRIRDQRIRR